MSLDGSSASDPSGSDQGLAAWLDQMSGVSIDREALCHATAKNGRTYAEKTRNAAEDLLRAARDSTEEYVSQFVKLNLAKVKIHAILKL